MIGVYEKSMPVEMPFKDKLITAKNAGFDFMELSVDETEEKLNRLFGGDFLNEEKRAVSEAGLPVMTMCLSGHRKYPLGDPNPKIRQKSLEIMRAAVDFAFKSGIRIIQLAGYDVYYGESTEKTRADFKVNLKKCVDFASDKGVILAFETMETPFMNTIEKAVKYVSEINSPYLQVYPDMGNIRNGAADYLKDIEFGKGHIAACHLKETKEGVYRNLFFGEGRVDFKGCIETLKKQGVNIYNCEFWYDGKSEPLAYLKKARDYFKNLL